MLANIRRQTGVSMIEVLVTIAILVIGLLGLAGLQARLQISEIESYQRAQALILMKDMANRMMANRRGAAEYVIGTTATGAGVTCPTDTSTPANRDLREWCLALQGASTTSGGASAGAMEGGRGCIEATGSEYMITVAWQGMAPLSAPPASVACGQGSYGTTGACAGDLCRRVMTTVLHIEPLS
jgi:type IV pilus assembly protein PilV